MPIAGFKPTAPVPVIQTSVTSEAESFQSVTVDDAITPISSLIGYVEGAPWSVTYYSQVLTQDSDLREQDIGEANMLQQYTKIDNMEIRVTTPLTSSQNLDNAQITVGGTALVYPFLIPNVGDMFIADAGFGNTGIYQVKSVERKSFNQQSVYSIDYVLMMFADPTNPRLLDLDAKATTEYVFDKERMDVNQTPKLTTKDFGNLMTLKDSLGEIISFYFKTFYVKNYDTLVIPGQNTGAYDSFLVHYILKMVDTFDCYEIRFVRDYATDAEYFLQQDQFWNAMYNRNAKMLPYCNKTMGLVETKYFNYNSMFKGFRHSRLSYVMYPTNPDFSLFDPNTPSSSGDPMLLDYGVFVDSMYVAQPMFKPQSLTQLMEASSQKAPLTSLVSNAFVMQNASLPIINPVLAYDTYVLSPAFYSQGANQTLLESLVSAYLNREPLSLNKLMACVANYRTWGRLEQFYYIPILITLIKTIMVEPYS